MTWLRGLVVLLLATSWTRAGDWAQWLGPERNGGSAEKVAPWKGAELKKLWSVPAGEGHSAPVVADGRVYLFARVKDKNEEELQAFDAVKGTKLWSKTYARAAFNNEFGNGPRSTPTVADGKVYTYGVTGVLTCFDAVKGDQLWQVDTLKQFKAPNLFFGVSTSPLVDGDRVVVEVGKGTGVAAFKIKDGELAWKSLEDAASYSSPVTFGTGKAKVLVAVTQAGVVGLNPDDGKSLWQFPLVDMLNESSTTPVKIGDGLFLASSVTFGSVGLKMEEKDGKPGITQVWKNPALTCYFGTPVAVGKEHVYLVTGSLIGRTATLRCVEAASGKELWNKPKVGKYHASLLRTGDDKILMLEEGGSLVLIEPNAKEYKELSRAKVCGFTWAHPALAHGRLYVRDAKELTCVQMGE